MKVMFRCDTVHQPSRVLGPMYLDQLSRACLIFFCAFAKIKTIKRKSNSTKLKNSCINPICIKRNIFTNQV